MKSTAIIIASVIALGGLAILEESRISKLNARIAVLESNQASIDARTPRNSGKTKLARTKKSSTKESPQRETAAIEKSAKGADFGETMRKIYDNKAGQAMIREENRRRASSIYDRLIKSLDLSPEEEEHFIDLLAPSVGEQDRVGMALFNAKNDEERIKLIDDMEEDQVERADAIKTFLNDDTDFDEYQRYHARKSEYEQISTINTVMEDSGSPMKPEQESELIEAMFEARTETGLSERWEGREGFYQYGKPGVSKRFEEDWGAMQSNLNGRVGDILDDSQQGALQEHQQQIEQFILMGIRMAETMIQGAKQQKSGQ